MRKFVAPEIVFGPGTCSLAGRYVAGLGAERALVVTDPGVIAAGWTDRVLASLADAGIAATVFDNITSNPRSGQVMDGARMYQQHECEAIVSVGGGSPTDAAKGIGIVVSNGGHILDYAGVDFVEIPIPPLVCVPTTSGASADVSQFAIITDEHRGVKVAVITKAMVPDVALIDPETLMTMSRELTACTILDALTHAFEAYVSNGSSALTDVHALYAVEVIANRFTDALANLDDIMLRQHMMMASLQAGLAFSNASLGAVHAMAHSLGGLLDLPHGHCNALLLPHVVEANYDAAPERFARLAQTMGVVSNDPAQTRSALVERLHELVDIAGVERSLGALGVGTDTVSHLASTASLDPCLVTNPRDLTEHEIRDIYVRAL